MPQTGPKRLSASFVRTVKRPGRYGDGHGGHGLSLLVKPRAHGGVAKSWSQRLRINGKPCNVGLGPFPIVNLAEAREAALENARAVYRGHDPRMGSATPSFDKAAEIVIEMRAGTWRNPLTADVWRSSFRRLVSPVIGGNRSAMSPVPMCCPCLRRSGMMGGRRRHGGCGIGSAR